MNERRPRPLWPLILFAVVIGAVSYILWTARPAAVSPPHNSTASGSDHLANSTPAAAQPVELIAVDRAAFDDVIARHRGKVVLVDYWATWCLPCVEQLPHTLELARQYGDRGLAVVTLSLDEPAETPRVEEFLRGKQAGGATHLISQFGGSSRSIEEFEIASGAVPYYQLYDRHGRLRHTFGIDPATKKQFSPANIDAAVQQLLNE